MRIPRAHADANREVTLYIRVLRSLWCLALVLVPACGSETTSPAIAPAVLSSTAAYNPHNVISAFVTVGVQHADSVAVRFGIQGQARDSLTAAVTPTEGTALVPVFGLLPNTAYDLQAVAWGRNAQVAVGPLLRFTAGTLPGDLPQYVADGPAPSPGYVVFAAGMYGVVVDNHGRIVWYHRFPEGPGLNFQAQPNGRYTARPPPANTSQPAPWFEIDPLGNTTRLLDCVGGPISRFHDLIAEVDGSYWMLCDEVRTMDLSALGGVANARVIGTTVQHVSANGSLLFQWKALNHFALTDLDSLDRATATVNFTHGNALDMDTDGNLILSFRSLNEITKIDSSTGAVLWRMGGIRNQFTFQGTSVPAFARQHGLRVTGSNSFLLLDNMGDPAGSRAEQYSYDAAARVARLTASYGSLPPVVAQLGGTTQLLPGGRTLVSFGSGGRVEEYDSQGNSVWHIENPGYVFRAQRIRSLYHPAVLRFNTAN